MHDNLDWNPLPIWPPYICTPPYPQVQQLLHHGYIVLSTYHATRHVLTQNYSPNHSPKFRKTIIPPKTPPMFQEKILEPLQSKHIWTPPCQWAHKRHRHYFPPSEYTSICRPQSHLRKFLLQHSPSKIWNLPCLHDFRGRQIRLPPNNPAQPPSPSSMLRTASIAQYMIPAKFPTTWSST